MFFNKHFILLMFIFELLITLSSQRKPPDRLEIITQPTSNYLTLDGKKYQFKCEAIPANAEIQWLFNGQSIHESPLKGFYRVSSNVLTIRLYQASTDKSMLKSSSNSNLLSSSSSSISQITSSTLLSPLSQSSSSTSLFSSSSSSLLPLINVTTLQGGRIQCIAYNRKDALLSQTAKLLIPYLDPFPLNENNLTLTINEEQTAVIPCKLPSSIPTVVSEFIYNENTLIHKSNDRYQLMPSGNLHIISSKVTDSGYYKCVSFNPYIREKRNATNYVHLIVNSKLTHRSRERNIKFTVKPLARVSAILGTNVTLECIVNSNSLTKVNWYKEGGVLPKNRHHLIGTNLVLIEVRSTEDGVYICEAVHSAKTITASTTLQIQEIPQIIVGIEEKRASVGDVVTFECIARGKPTPIISWYFNGHAIDMINLFNGHLYKESNGSRIVIDKVTSQKYSGIYQCFATNELNEVTSYARLTVIDSKRTRDEYDTNLFNRNAISQSSQSTTSSNSDIGKNFDTKPKSSQGKKRNKGIEMVPPSRPEISRLSEDSVMVRWNVPKNDGLPILFFKVQYKEVGKNEWMTIDTDIAPHIHSYAVSNLRTDSVYRFRIAAVYSNNDNKSGKTSSKFVLHKEPPMKRPQAPPLIIDAVALSPTSIEIKWEYTNNENIKMEGFFIHYRPTLMASDYLKITVEGAATRSHIITHLSAETAYDIKMLCFNVAGTSLFSNIFTSKTQASADSIDKDKKGDNEANNENNNVITDYVPVTSKDDQTLYYIIGVSIAAIVLVIIVIVILCLVRNKPVVSENEINHDHKVNNNLNLKKSVSLNHVSQSNTEHNGQSYYNNHHYHNNNHHHHHHLYQNGTPRTATISSHHSLIYPKSLHLSNGHLNNEKKLNILANEQDEMESLQICLKQCTSNIDLKHSKNGSIETGEHTTTATLTTVHRVMQKNVSQNSLERRRSNSRYTDEAYPAHFTSNQRINNRVSSFSRLNGTLERKRRTEIVSPVDKESEPMLSRCKNIANGNSPMVIMQSSC